MPPLTAEPEEQEESLERDGQGSIGQDSIRNMFEDHEGMTQPNNISDFASKENQHPSGNLEIKGSAKILEDNPQLKRQGTNPNNKPTEPEERPAGQQIEDQAADIVKNEAKEATKQVVKKTAALRAQALKQAAATAFRTAATALAPYLIPILVGLAIIVVIIILGLVIYSAFLGKEGDTGKQIGVNLSGRLNGTVHCKEMVDTIKIPTRNGKSSILLTLHETSGGFSAEGGATINADGMPIMGDPANNDYMAGAEDDLGDLFSMSSELKQKNITMEELAFYATARWMFKGSYLLDDLKVQERGLPAKKYFAGQKVMFYNPKNKIAAIAIISEVGPAANLRDRFAGGPAKGAYNKYNAKHGTSYKSLGDILGVNSGDQVVMSFLDPAIAKDPVKGKVGLTTCTEVSKTVESGIRVTNESSHNNIGTPHFIPGVPAIGQDENTRICNEATAVMTVLTYNPNAASKLVVQRSNTYPTVNTSYVVKNTLNTINDELVGVKDSKGKSIRYQLINEKPSVQSIKNSIDNGDPVVAVMGARNLLSDGQHFVLVVGYDNENFYINDPYPWGDNTIHVYTNRGHIAPNNTLKHADFINDMKSETKGGYYAIMRKR